jgi:hypothetical protein
MYVYTVHSIFYCYILLSFVRMMRLSTGSKRASSSSQGGTSSRTASSSLVPQIARQLIPDNNQDDAEMEDEEVRRSYSPEVHHDYHRPLQEKMASPS